MECESRPAPRLSVALCTYNGEAYLREFLDSLARQTRLPDELVVCDDRSTDRTAEIVEQFAATAPFPVSFSRNAENCGSTRNFENAIRRCSGDLISLADQDDVWAPAKLERSEEALANAPDADVVFSDAELVDDQLRPLGIRLWETSGFGPRKRERFLQGHAMPILLRTQVVTGATMVFRSRLRELVLPIPSGVVHDGWIAVLTAAASRLTLVDEPLMLYRQHASNQIGAVRKGLAERFIAARATRADVLAGALEWMLQAEARLVAAGHGTSRGARQLRAKARHLRARVELPRPRLRRLPLVLREMASGDYARYSNGFFSAAEDLVC